MSDDPPLFTGVIPALITPFTKGGAVDTAAVPALIDHLISKGASAFYLCGSSGEGMHMSVDESKAMAEAAINAVAGRVPCMIMVGGRPIADAVELAKHAAQAGAVAVSTVAPGAYAKLKLSDSDEPPPTFDDVIAYFATVAAATSLPFYGYWLGDIGTSDARVFLEAMKPISNFRGLKFTQRDFYLFERITDLAHSVLGRRLNMISGRAARLPSQRRACSHRRLRLLAGPTSATCPRCRSARTRRSAPRTTSCRRSSSRCARPSRRATS
jgi:dihydrodipicolinate synthase/N-acetylneuraminate lyase